MYNEYMNFKQKLYNFMRGRYGTDDLNRFFQYCFFVFFLLSVFCRGNLQRLFYALSLVMAAFTLFRSLSKDIYRRSDENTFYLKKKRIVFKFLKNLKERFVQRKDYKFFVCPSCKATLRVPRGRGKIKIVCRKCGNSFMGKS